MIYEEIKRGDILLVDLPYHPGSVQHGERPVIVIQNDKGNTFSGTLIVVPTTTAKKKFMPTHVFVPKKEGFHQDSTVLCEQILTIDKNIIIEKWGNVSFETMRKIDIATLISLGYV